MNKKLLSIIVPVYNVEKYLAECINSVLKQIDNNIEVIIVDDGSTDNSNEIIAEFYKNNSSYIKIVSKSNGGLSSARNAGIEVCEGQYIYFLDSDDYLLENAVCTIYECIRKYPSADIIQFDNIITTSNKRLNIIENSNKVLSMKEYFLQYQCKSNASVNACSYVYKYSVWIDKKLYFEEGKKHEDRLFLYSLLQYDLNIVVVHIDKPFYVFRINREGSISTNVNITNYIDRQYLWRKAFHIFNEIGVDPICYNNLYKYCLWVLCESYQKNMYKSLNNFFDKTDLMIMKKGINTPYERKLWLLTRLSPILMLKYYHNNVNRFLRKTINIYFTIYDRLYPIHL